MVNSKVFKNPPVREAVFDVRVKFANEPNFDLFEQYYKEVIAAYSKRDVTRAQTFSFQVKKGEKPVINHGAPNPIGLRLTSPDGKQVVQVQKTGFSFSRLQPYQKWDIFFEEAYRLFELYVKILEPEYCERIALRYINAIEIPETSFNIEDYLVTSPRISKDIPQAIGAFLYKVTIKDAKTENIAVITETLENTAKEGVTTILFDIDTYREGVKVKLGDELKETFLSLKELRTLIFETGITDKTKALFN